MPFKFNPFTNRLDEVTTASAIGAVTTLTGDTGGAISPDGSGNINVLGTSAQGISTAGAGSTVTWTIANATTTQKGVVALATNAETIAGTDTAKAVTADDVKAKLGTQTSHGFAFGTGTAAAVAWSAEPANGQLAIGSTGNQPVLANITSGDSSITITNGAGSIALAVAGGTSVGKTITGDTGGALSPTAGNWNIVGTTTQGITSSGSGSTLTFTNANATTTQKGVVALATNAEAIAGTDTAKAITADDLKAKLGTQTIHGVLVGAGTTAAVTALAAGTALQVLQSGGAGADPAYSTATYPATTTVSQLLYSSATNVVAGLATANRAVVTTNATGVPVVTALATDGQLIIGSTAGAPAAASLTAGTGITITPGSNSITIAASATAFTWQNISASQTLAVNNGYQCTGGGALALLLPATSVVGDVIEITLDGSTSWTVTQGASQAIRYGNVVTTGGGGGSLASTVAGDTIRMVCSVANLRWNVLSSIGNLTVV